MVAQPPCSSPTSRARSGCTSQNISGCNSARYGTDRVIPPLGHVEPAAAVRLHDERMVARDGVLGLRVVGRHVAGLLVLLEVGDVDTGPLAFAAVPPDVALALGPGV